ncbi:MAG: GyrI-like domain-containing protein, partial [Pirellulaceae bacterium]
CPNPHPEECELEIRPVFEADDFGPEFTSELREQEAKGRAHVLGLESPRFENGRDMIIAGLNHCYEFSERMQIPAQWQKFVPYVGKIPGQVDQVTYGVSWNQRRDCGFDYLTGVEVTSTDELPAEFTHVKLAARRYVVFPHRRHISEIGGTFEKIWAQWVPEAGLPIATEAPTFERYTEEFSDEGSGIEIWIPLQNA